MERDLKIWALFLIVAGVSAQNTSVSVSCGSSHLTIAVPVNLFGSGVVVSADELTLGSHCAVTAVHTNVLLLEYPLFACGATRKILPGSIHYRNILHYVPSTANGVIRSSGFSHPIDCFYPRSWNVSSLGLKPTWAPFTSTVMDRQRLDFALEVYDSSWSLPLSDPVYYLGDLINIQASVRKGSHVPLKIYVDECVARPSADSSVKYEVITNHGCLVDGQRSSSRFLASREDGIIRFQLDTFTFIGASNNQIYLICHLKAVSISSTGHRNKACSYDQATATWNSHEGADCSCCASPSGCGDRRRRRKRGQQQRGMFGETDAKLGPIELKAEQVNFSMVNNSNTSEFVSTVASFATSRTSHAARIPANQVVNIIMRGGVKEDAPGTFSDTPYCARSLRNSNEATAQQGSISDDVVPLSVSSVTVLGRIEGGCTIFYSRKLSVIGIIQNGSPVAQQLCYCYGGFLRGLNFPFSTATLVIIVASSIIVLVSVVGCYCSTKRSHRGYHMETARAPLGQPSAVAMAPATVGSSGPAVSGESSAASKKPDGPVLAVGGQPTI